MQLAYNNFPSSPRAGSLADLNEAIIVTRVSDDNIPFGRFVVLDDAGTDPKIMPKVMLPAAATDVFNSDNFEKCEGIVVVTQSQQAEYGVAPVSALPEYLAGQPMNIIRHGIVWVYTEEAVTPADTPFVRFTEHDGLLAGNFRKSADVQGGNATAVSLAGTVRFMQGTTGAGLVPVMIRL